MDMTVAVNFGEGGKGRADCYSGGLYTAVQEISDDK